MDSYLQLLSIVFRVKQKQNRANQGTTKDRHDDIIITCSVTALSAMYAREDFGTKGQRWKAKARGNKKPLSAFYEENSVIPTEGTMGGAYTQRTTA
jgi:hypothetical protein